MRQNRSMPPSSVIPVLGYPAVTETVAWLVRAFGFEERLRIGSHRVQLTVGDGALVVTSASAEAVAAMSHTQSLMVRVDDADAHHARALAERARIVSAPQGRAAVHRGRSARLRLDVLAIDRRCRPVGVGWRAGAAGAGRDVEIVRCRGSSLTSRREMNDNQGAT
jgi:hypothetical protein